MFSGTYRFKTAHTNFFDTRTDLGKGGGQEERFHAKDPVYEAGLQAPKLTASFLALLRDAAPTAGLCWGAPWPWLWEAALAGGADAGGVACGDCGAVVGLPPAVTLVMSEGPGWPGCSGVA